jgi:TonB family protein
MKSKTLLLAALAALPLAQLPRAAAAPVRDAAPRQSSSQPGEEFSVEMPAMPFVFETRRLVGRKEEEAVRTFGLYSGGVAYVVTSFDNPRGHEGLGYFAAFPGSEGDRQSVRDLKLGGFDGKEYEQAGVLRSRMRVFRAKRHAYRVTAVTDGAEDARFARFLDSFALGGGQAGREIRDLPPANLVISSTPAGPLGPGRGGGSRPAEGAGDGERPKPAPSEGAPPAHVAGEPYRSAEVSRKALIIYKPPPGFTEEARRNNVSGVVRLRVVLGAGGRVRKVSVVRGLPDGLTESAVFAALHILFFPAVKDGQTVSQYATLEYNFNIY